MNLHSIVAGAIGTVNPFQPVTVQISTGPGATSASGKRSPTFATPCSITGSIGGTFTATSAGTTLTVAAVLTGTLQPGDTVSGTDGVNSMLVGTTIVEQLSGTAGEAGTYELSQPASGNLGSCTVTSLSTVLNVTAVAQGSLQNGQTLSDGGVALAPGTSITGLLTGSGGVGTYQVSFPQTVPSEAMTTALTLLADIQALSTKDLRQIDGLNLQGTLRAIYLNGAVAGLVRPTQQGGDIITFPDGTVWLVNQVLEPWSLTAGWCKAICTLQNGS